MHKHKPTKAKFENRDGCIVKEYMCRSCGELLDKRTKQGLGNIPIKFLRKQKQWDKISALFRGKKQQGISFPKIGGERREMESNRRNKNVQHKRNA